MKINKALRILLIAFVGFCLVTSIFYFITLSSSKPVDQPAVYGKVQKAAAADYNNCIILYPEKPVFITAGINDSLTTGQIIPSVNNLRESVQKGPFNIIITPETSQELIAVALNACTTAGLKDYRILEL